MQSKRRECYEEDNLVRLHPIDSGKTIIFNEQRFQGISPDVFIALDRYDPSSAYEITRKFNISLQINPLKYDTKEFFRYYTRGEETECNPFSDPFIEALQPTKKCRIHGDDRTNLRAHQNLINLLMPGIDSSPATTGLGFKLDGTDYLYHSIGVAANPGYDPVGLRRTSHFEIKFIRQSRVSVPRELLCLNIHLSATRNNYGRDEVSERLTQGIKLFYTELGLLEKKYQPISGLKDSLGVTLDNYKSMGFSCKNPVSLAVLAARQEVLPYIKSSSNVNQKEMSISDLVSPLIDCQTSTQSVGKAKSQKRKVKKVRQAANLLYSFFDTRQNEDDLSKLPLPEAIAPSKSL